MQKITTDYGGRYRVVSEYKAERKEIRRPELTQTTTIDNGIEYFRGVNGRLFIASKFESVFGKVNMGKEGE